jgi:D-alanyl-D-alanine carboxypeptidase
MKSLITYTSSLFCLIILFMLSVSTAPAVVAQSPETANNSIENLDSWIEDEMRERQIPGLSIAVLENGRVVKAHGYGLANVEFEVEATEHTIFQSGSIGKTFTAAAVLLLAEEGKLDLDDPIIRHLEELPKGWRLITIRHLLNHTSGLPDYWEPTVDLRQDYTESELLQAFSNLTPHFPPGEEWSYSNTGYAILGALVSRITGDHWGVFVKERIFEPAGMEMARVISEDAIVPNRADGYRLVEGELRNHEWVSPTFNSTADGALYLTVHDLARWDEAINSGSILSEESWRLMLTPTRLSDGEEAGYGLGWQVGNVNGRPFVGHGGAWQGFASQFTRFHDDSLTVIVLVNLAWSEARADRFAIKIAEYYRPVLQPTSFVPINIPEEVLESYVGIYWLPSGRLLEVSRVQGGITVAGAGVPPGTIYRPYDAQTFIVEDVPEIITFQTDPITDLANKLIINNELRARKIR